MPGHLDGEVMVRLTGNPEVDGSWWRHQVGDPFQLICNGVITEVRPAALPGKSTDRAAP